MLIVAGTGYVDPDHRDTLLTGAAQTAPPMPHVRSVQVMRYEISSSSQLQG
jgi:hypothetical protein